LRNMPEWRDGDVLGTALTALSIVPSILQYTSHVRACNSFYWKIEPGLSSSDSPTGTVLM